MAFGRLLHVLLLLLAFIIGGSATNTTDCSANQLKLIDMIAAAERVKMDLYLCYTLTNYKIYPFGPIPTGKTRNLLCHAHYCRAAAKSLYTSPLMSQCYIKVNGTVATPAHHIKSLC
jgi:hypothetical protein